jgi:hypothetical protein
LGTILLHFLLHLASLKRPTEKHLLTENVNKSNTCTEHRAVLDV